MEYRIENYVGLTVRSIVIKNGRLLVQKGSVDPSSNDLRTCYAFIGGHYEAGDTMEYRLKKEFEEETNARVVSCTYAFVVENRSVVNGVLRQGIEHYFSVAIDREDISTKESHITQHWLPMDRLKEFDLRPKILRDLIATGEWVNTRHIVVPLSYE